ncbi:hypothetical protein LZ32DRAFT_614896 [Colletotrichum eremochloae]|nr:hypothetical protein LZ32DRAFT_614896 [Colletotrichum eremochloae]
MPGICFHFNIPGVSSHCYVFKLLHNEKYKNGTLTLTIPSFTFPHFITTTLPHRDSVNSFDPAFNIRKMRVSAVGLALWAAAVLAIPSEKDYHYRSTEEIKEGMLPLSEMTFIGPVTVGGPDVTLQGDASSIYGQILALNPTFDANTFGHSVAEATDSVSPERSLDTRQTTASLVSSIKKLDTASRS